MFKNLPQLIIFKIKLCITEQVVKRRKSNKRHLKVRSGEHLSVSALTGKRVNNSKKSVVKNHCLFFDHVGSFEDFSILKYKSNPFKLLIKESFLVSKDKRVFNKQV